MKRSAILLLLCLLILSLSGCEADRSAIYDDDAKIAASADSHASTMSVYSHADQELSMMARSFTGAKTVWRYTAEGDEEVTFTYSFSTGEGGRAKLVLIGPDKQVITLTDSNASGVVGEMQAQTITLSKGESRIKVVGDDSQSLNLVLGATMGTLADK